MTARGWAIPTLALAALAGAACDLNIDFDERRLSDAPTEQTPPVDAPPPRMCTPVVAEVTPEYEAMCRHYCDELEATLTYAGTTQEPAGAVSQSCWELRCAPRCVSQETCGQQCHALGVQYQALCGGVEPAAETTCPVTIDERVSTCLVGCGLAAPPEEPPPDVVR
jgi:hypothetical protein